MTRMMVPSKKQWKRKIQPVVGIYVYVYVYKLLCVSAYSTPGVHRCPLCGKMLSDLNALMVRMFCMTDDDCCFSTLVP